MKSAEAIANGIATKMAINAVTTEPTNIAPMPKTAVDVSSGFPMSHFEVVMNFNPKSEKISKPRYSKKAAIMVSTTREKSAHDATKPRNTRSTLV
jgi:hypothetical protein